MRQRMMIQRSLAFLLCLLLAFCNVHAEELVFLETVPDVEGELLQENERSESEPESIIDAYDEEFFVEESEESFSEDELFAQGEMDEFLAQEVTEEGIEELEEGCEEPQVEPESDLSLAGDGSIGAIQISTAEEFLKIYENPSGTYELMNDISLGGVALPENVTFFGSLNGNNHNLTGVVIKENSQGYTGLFSVVRGGIQNLKLNATASISNANQREVGLLAGSVGGSIRNCEISGTIKLTQSNSDWLTVGGLTGDVWTGGTLENCTSYVTLDLTINGNNCNAGGLAGFLSMDAFASNCTYNGSIKVEQSGSSNGYYNVSGMAPMSTFMESPLISGGKVYGDITFIGEGGTADVFGIYGADHSATWASLDITSENARITAVGAKWGTDLANHGDLKLNVTGTPESGVCSVAGVAEAEDSTNDGAVEASSDTARVNAYGLDHCVRSSNSGTVTIYANADGLLGIASGASFCGDDCQNEGAVMASSTSLQAELYAEGISGDEGTYGHGLTNSGTVTVTAPAGNLGANGLVHARNGSNEGEIRATATKNGKESVLTAIGTRECVNSNNEAGITAEYAGAGFSHAAGLEGCEGGINRGSISATTDGVEANAYGVENCSGATNYGSVTAVCSEESKEGAAQAYGATGSNNVNHGSINAKHHFYAIAYGTTSGTSDAQVSAYTTFTGDKPGDINAGKSHALGSTRVSAGNPKYSLSPSMGQAAGAYLFVPRQSCDVHKNAVGGVVTFQEPANGLDGCYYRVGYAESQSGNGSSDDPLPEDDPDKDPEGSLKVTTMGLYDGEGESAEKITVLDFYCGSFSYYTGEKKTVNVKDPATTHYSEVTLKVDFDGTEGTRGYINVTLPAGLSFEADKVVRAKSLEVSVGDGNQNTKEVPVYLLYSENYSNGAVLSAEWKALPLSGDGTTEGTRNLAVVRQEQASWNDMHIRRNINGSDAYETFSWNANMFLGDPTEYSRDMAVFSAYLAEMMEDGNKERLEKRVAYNMIHMGFSDIFLGGNSEGFEEEFVIAQKKIVTQDNKVKNAVVFAIQGSDSTEDWICNCVYYGEAEEHWNFAGIAYALKTAFDKYYKDQGISISDSNNRLLVTGHSRGGAVANYFTGAILNANEGVRKARNTYSYTYAAVNSINASAYKDHNAYWHDNCYNFANYLDAVPFVPGELTKFGRSFVFNTDNESHEKLISYARLLSLTKLAKDHVLLKMLVQEVVDEFLDGRLDAVGDAHSMTHYISAVQTMDLPSFHDFDSWAGYLTNYGRSELTTIRGLLSKLDLRWIYASGLVSVVLSSDGQAKAVNHSTGMTEEMSRVLEKLNFDQGDPQSDLKALYERIEKKHPILCKALTYDLLVLGWLTLGPIRGTRLGLRLRTEPKQKEVLQINCPVDIILRDAKGNVLLEIQNDEVTYVNSNDIVYEGLNDKKTIYFLNTIDYSIETKGYADGKMDYSVTTYDDNGDPQETRLFENLIVQKEKTALVETKMNREYIFKNADEASIEPTLRLSDHEVCSVSIQTSSDLKDVTMSGSGSYTIGDRVTVTASDDTEKEFLGWYDDKGNKLSDERVYSFIASRDLNVTAKYQGDNSGENPGEQGGQEGTDQGTNSESSGSNSEGSGSNTDGSGSNSEGSGSNSESSGSNSTGGNNGAGSTGGNNPTPANTSGTTAVSTSKKANTLKVVVKTVTVKASKKKKTIAAKKVFQILNAQGKVSYKKKSGSKALSINKKGKIAVAKNTKKGTYKMKVVVTAEGNAQYKKGSKTVTVKVKVKK